MKYNPEGKESYVVFDDISADVAAMFAAAFLAFAASALRYSSRLSKLKMKSSI
jgi:hypothetical protein